MASFNPKDIFPIDYPEPSKIGGEFNDIKYYPSDINLVTLAKRFGLNAARIVPYIQDPNQKESAQQYIERVADLREKEVRISNKETSNVSNLFGLPVFNQTILTKADSPTKGAILNECIIRVNQRKEIIATPIGGFRGTVKEIMGTSDYEINMVGLMASSQPQTYNTEELKILLDLLKYSGDIVISNEYLEDLFGVTQITVLDYELAQSESYSNIIFFNINALSNNIVPIAY